MDDIVFLTGLFTVAALAIFLLMSSLLDDIFKLKYSKVFLQDLKKATEKKTLTPEQITTLAESRNLDTRYTVYSVKKAIGDLLTEDDENNNKIAQLEAYLKHIKTIEPFEGVPSDLRIHLERIKDTAPSVGNLLDPLAIQIKELAAVRNREVRLQKYYTAGGFFIGLIGIAIAVWMYINPPQNQLKSQIPPTSATDAATQSKRAR